MGERRKLLMMVPLPQRNSARNLMRLMTQYEALCVSLHDPSMLRQAVLQGLCEAEKAGINDEKSSKATFSTTSK